MSGNARDGGMRLSRPDGLRPSGIRLTMVCGPCGAGKSTFVAKHAAERDIVIDLDIIAGELCRRPIQRIKSAALLEWSLTERNRRLRTLADETDLERWAWFIISAPDAAERAWWEQRLRPESIVIVATPLAICLHRIGHDADRAEGRLRMQRWAEGWWQTFAATGGRRPNEFQIEGVA